MASIIRWEEPPASQQGRRSSGERTATVKVLQQRPGEWALVAETVSASAVVPWKKLGCEAVGRRSTKDPKKTDIYVRWPKGQATAQQDTVRAQARKAELRASYDASAAQTAKPTSPAGRPVKPAKASLPISTVPKTLDLNDPKDAALLRTRQKYEADRQARITRGSTR